MTFHNEKGLISSALCLAILLLVGGCAFQLTGQSIGQSTGQNPAAGAAADRCDLAVVGGTLVDGTGAKPRRADVLLQGTRILRIDDSSVAGSTEAERSAAGECARVLDVTNLIVAPGFINMLSWATESLLEDPRALSDLYQGVTLEVMGEGRSMGPYSEAQAVQVAERQRDVRYEVDWRTLGGYFERLERAGLGVNVASYVGATTVREHVLGAIDRAPDATELEQMRRLVREAMAEGAMGVGSSLIYAPANFASTEELIALASEAAAAGGGYISHLRSEGFDLLPALDELIEIARASGARAQVYHLKASGRAHWPKLDAAIARIVAVRAAGTDISANIYPYIAGASGLDAVMPPWVQEGGIKAWVERLKQPAIRERLAVEMRDPNAGWENFLLDGADKVLLLGFKNPALRGYIGKTLAEVARLQGTSPEEAAMDLVIADGSEVDVAYFFMAEANVRKKLGYPWVSIGSDASAPAAAGVFLNAMVHPRAYGSFARVLGKYVREEKVLSLHEAVRRMTGLPAEQLGLADRGLIRVGHYADLAIFDAAQVRDVATFADPHRYAEGMVHVFVNGEQVLSSGEPTGALPGMIVRGPGWRAPTTNDVD